MPATDKKYGKPLIDFEEIILHSSNIPKFFNYSEKTSPHDVLFKLRYIGYRTENIRKGFWKIIKVTKVDA